MVAILGANSVSGGYEIDNSLRFNDNDSAKLGRTPSSAGNKKTFTFSSWFKRGNIGIGIQLFDANGTGSTENDFLKINSNDTMQFRIKNSNSVVTNLIPTQVFRDPSAWYHIVLAWDTTQSTESNRVKIYLNGSQITDFSTASYPTQNLETSSFNNTVVHSIGAEYYSGSYYTYYDGYMAETHFIDSTAKAPTDFGEVDDNGVWIPKAYDGTYGTNGFYLEFKQTGTSANSSGIGADTSGNDNHWTPTNLAATDITTDTCTNNFATMNPLFFRSNTANGFVGTKFSEGNTLSTQSDANLLQFGTFLVTKGKWYMEVKIVDVGGLAAVGIINPQTYDNGNPDTKSIVYRSNGQKKNLDSASSYGNSFTDDDIIGMAFDADDGNLYFYKNGTAENSGTAAFTSIDTSTGYVMGGYGYNGVQSNNYGQPSFAVSSSNADANGYGNFEYAPPSGYYSLCTKNLAEFG